MRDLVRLADLLNGNERRRLEVLAQLRMVQLSTPTSKVRALKAELIELEDQHKRLSRKLR